MKNFTPEHLGDLYRQNNFETNFTFDSFIKQNKEPK
jgi:hypothetical protein